MTLNIDESKYHTSADPADPDVWGTNLKNDIAAIVDAVNAKPDVAVAVSVDNVAGTFTVTGAGATVDADTITYGDSGAVAYTTAGADARYGSLTAPNQWLGRAFFNRAATPLDSQYTGSGADFTGDVNDTTTRGGIFARISANINFAGGTNGTRGDAVSSTAANGANSTQFFGLDVEAYNGTSGFTGRGSANLIAARGSLGVADVSNAYGEMGGIVSQVTNNRAGGLAEAAEFELINNVQAKNAIFVGIVADNAGQAGLASYNWSRGLWLTSSGTQTAGDAIFLNGAAGWTNYLNFAATDGSQRFRVDNSGKQYVGANARTLYDANGGLKTDANLTVGAALIASGLFCVADPNAFLYWGVGVPNGVTSAAPGSIYLNRSGGAGTTLYVKESGAGNTGWVGK